MKRFDSTALARSILNKVRSQVSTDRLRTKDEETSIELDMSYITSNIIAMAMPAEGVASLYRNAVEDVVQFLKKHHDNNYMVWNLSEHEYDVEKFDNQVINCMFPDHHPPPFDRLLKVVTSIDNWLKADPTNVAVIHCKGGKGRTGTVIVCALFFSGICSSIEEADELFAKRRSAAEKGVTQPSQRRYISYFNSVFDENHLLNLQPICLKSVVLSPMPYGQTYILEIYDSVLDGALIFRALFPPILPETPLPMVNFEINIDVQGDLYIKLLRKKRKTKESYEKEFHVCFNTMFVDSVQIQLQKDELDTIKSQRYSDDLVLGLTFGPPMSDMRKPTSDPLIERMIQQFHKEDNYRRRKQPLSKKPQEPRVHPLVRQPSGASSPAAAPSNIQSPQPSAWQSVKVEQINESDPARQRPASPSSPNSSGNVQPRPARPWVSTRASGLFNPATIKAANTSPTTAKNVPNSSSAVAPASNAEAMSNTPDAFKTDPNAHFATMRHRSDASRGQNLRARERRAALARPQTVTLERESVQWGMDGPVSPRNEQSSSSSSSNSNASPSMQPFPTAIPFERINNLPTGSGSSSLPASPSTSMIDESTMDEQHQPGAISPRSTNSDGPHAHVHGLHSTLSSSMPDLGRVVSEADNEFLSVLSAMEAIGIKGATRIRLDLQSESEPSAPVDNSNPSTGAILPNPDVQTPAQSMFAPAPASTSASTPTIPAFTFIPTNQFAQFTQQKMPQQPVQQIPPSQNQ